MRRVTVHKPLSSKKETAARRLRERTDERPAARPEIRADIARTWWPDA
ncbi:hypothetical protein AB0G32_22000 [Streptomyces sp. NPDC023723]|jgi:hypothetical protein